jgi:mannose-6-phosphate isomerase
MNWYPIRFAPIYQQRVWGGRRLASVYGRSLPDGAPIGESWEISDRQEAQSVVANGPLAGRTLHQLIAEDPSGVMGQAALRAGRFPLLIKILDAREVLSLQVHPPAGLAASMGGESKTEMWYFTAADAGAEILAGLRSGTTRTDFERQLTEGKVEQCFHRLAVHPGDAMFLPSGRVHALGAGLLLFEIQENSDTTYRVFDWNRRGLDGKQRPLHVAESLASIDFGDHAPGLVASSWVEHGGLGTRLLAGDPLFRVEAHRGPDAAWWRQPLDRCVVVGVVRGGLRLGDPVCGERLGPGDFCLLPAGLEVAEARLEGETEWLTAAPGAGGRL